MTTILENLLNKIDVKKEITKSVKKSVNVEKNSKRKVAYKKNKETKEKLTNILKEIQLEIMKLLETLPNKSHEVRIKGKKEKLVLKIVKK